MSKIKNMKGLEKVIACLGAEFDALIERVTKNTIADEIARREKLNSNPNRIVKLPLELSEKEVIRFKSLVTWSIKCDIARGISVYIKDSYELRNVALTSSGVGFEVSLEAFENDVKIGYLKSEFILAGGYNIQKLHVRLIVHTDLEKMINDDEKNIKNIIKEINSIESTEKNITAFKKYIDSYNEKIESLKSLIAEQPKKKEFLESAKERISEVNENHVKYYSCENSQNTKEIVTFEYYKNYQNFLKESNRVFRESDIKLINMTDADIQKEVERLEKKAITDDYNYPSKRLKVLEKEVSKIESDLIKETEKLESLNSKLVK